MPINKSAKRFIIVFSALLITWASLYELLLKPMRVPDEQLTKLLTQHIVFALNKTGYEASFSEASAKGGQYVFIAPFERQTVRIGNSCNGLELYMLFILFMIAFPGQLKPKLVYSIIALAGIYILNIFRTYVLTLMAYYRYPHYDLFHRYIFVFLIYGFVFILWHYWTQLSAKYNYRDESKA